MPIPIPSSYFRSLQTVLNTHLWEGKKPRCAHSNLIENKVAEGVGSIDFKDYYLASILGQLPGMVLTPACHSLGSNRILPPSSP